MYFLLLITKSHWKKKFISVISFVGLCKKLFISFITKRVIARHHWILVMSVLDLDSKKNFYDNLSRFRHKNMINRDPSSVNFIFKKVFFFLCGEFTMKMVHVPCYVFVESLLGHLADNGWCMYEWSNDTFTCVKAENRFCSLVEVNPRECSFQWLIVRSWNPWSVWLEFHYGLPIT